jgi:hypothetical protein
MIAVGVARMIDNPKAVVVLLEEAPSEADLRRIHLATQQLSSYKGAEFYPEALKELGAEGLPATQTTIRERAHQIWKRAQC